MKAVEAGIGGEALVDAVLVFEVFEDVEVAAVGGVEERGESLVVFGVHPVGDLLVFVPLIERFMRAFLSKLFPALFDEEFDDVELTLEGELV